MSQESAAPKPAPHSSKNDNPTKDFKPSDEMKAGNRRVGLIFLGIVAFLVALTVITRIILSS